MAKIYRKIYIVIGGESTGTRMVTKLMMQGGCYGEDEHSQFMDGHVKEQRWDRIKKIIETQPIVWRRSFPHDAEYPNISREMVEPLRQGCGLSDRDFYFLVTFRDWFPASRSAAIRGHSSTPYTAIEKMREAYIQIFQFFSRFPAIDFYMVSYEGLVTYPHFAVPIMYRQAELHVPIQKMPLLIKDISDKNYKHFRGFKRDAWEDECEKD